MGTRELTDADVEVIAHFAAELVRVYRQRNPDCELATRKELYAIETLRMALDARAPEGKRCQT